MDRSVQSSEAAPEFPAPSASPHFPSRLSRIFAAPDPSALENPPASDPPDHKPASSPAHRDSAASSSSARLPHVPAAPAPRPHSTPTRPSAHPSHSSPA